MSQSSFVQVLVNASGKKASSTFFPRRPDSEMLLPIVEGNVKSGAGVPTAGAGLAMYPRGVGPPRTPGSRPSTAAGQADPPALPNAQSQPAPFGPPLLLPSTTS